MAEIKTPRAAPSRIPRKCSARGPPPTAFVRKELKGGCAEETTDAEALSKGTNRHKGLSFSGGRTTLPSDSAVVHMGRYYSAEELCQHSEKKPQKVTQWRYLARSLSTSNLHTTSIHHVEKKKTEVKKEEKREVTSSKQQGLSWSDHIVKLVSDKDPEKRQALHKSRSMRNVDQDDEMHRRSSRKKKLGGSTHSKQSSSLHARRSTYSSGPPSSKRSPLELNKVATRFSISGGDLADLVSDDTEFKKLKASLRNSGAVTNSILKQGLHFYVKETQERKRKQKVFRDQDLSSYGSWKSLADDDDDDFASDNGMTLTKVQLEWEIPAPAGFAVTTSSSVAATGATPGSSPRLCRSQ